MANDYNFVADQKQLLRVALERDFSVQNFQVNLHDISPMSRVYGTFPGPVSRNGYVIEMHLPQDAITAY